jgi:hypothetical protein
MTVTVASTVWSRSDGVVHVVPDVRSTVLVTIYRLLCGSGLWRIWIVKVVHDRVVHPPRSANKIIGIDKKTAVRGNVAGGISHHDVQDFISFCADDRCAQNLNPR